MKVITISRQLCSFGDEIAVSLSQKLGMELIKHETLLSGFMKAAAGKHELHMLSESAKFYLNTCRTGETYMDYLCRVLREYVCENPSVLVGFGSQAIFADVREALHIRVFAPKETRIARIKKLYHVSDEQARQILVKAEKKQKKFVSTLFGIDISDASHYQLMFNTAALSVDECVSAVEAMTKERETVMRMEQQAKESNVFSNISDVSVLKNQSEIEFARLLDMYHIDWKYEPKTFPVEWDAEGNVISAFSPDFFLPKFNTYIEITTMNQKYVTQKNKKIKKLKELYPGTNIKVIYKKDYRSLVERFNLEKEQ